jgi:hypothetical protein
VHKEIPPAGCQASGKEIRDRRAALRFIETKPDEVHFYQVYRDTDRNGGEVANFSLVFLTILVIVAECWLSTIFRVMQEIDLSPRR